jgi:hypothetical protein
MLDYKIDCGKKYQQLYFLETLVPTRTEKQMAQLEILAFGGLTPDLQYKGTLANSRVAWFVKDNIEQVKRCPG